MDIAIDFGGELSEPSPGQADQHFSPPVAAHLIVGRQEILAFHSLDVEEFREGRAQDKAINVTEQTIQSQDIKIPDVFQAFYAVPDYQRLYVGSVQQYRLRYIMAKLTQHIDLRAYGETEGTKWLSRYTGGGFEIEHIFPQQPSDEAAVEFGKFEEPQVANRLGNLVLVEKSINASLGNRPYSQKRDVYRQSQLLLTKALAERPKVGVHTKIDVAVAELDSFAQWNEAAVAKRQDKLTTLARDEVSSFKSVFGKHEHTKWYAQGGGLNEYHAASGRRIGTAELSVSQSIRVSG